MGLFDIFGSNRRSRDPEEMQSRYERALIEKERAESVIVLDKLEKNFWAMGEYFKNSEYDVMNFMAKQSAKSDLFNPDGVRPGLLHAREEILRKMKELGGLPYSKETITEDDIYDALVIIGRSGKAPILSDCCKSEVNWLQKNYHLSNRY